MKALGTDETNGKTGKTAVTAENRRNRSIIADAVKQMVLVVISLGFAKAFDLFLTTPETSATVRETRRLLAQCLQGSVPCPVTPIAFLVFCVYLLFGTRFLLTSWLYLSTTYRDDNMSNPQILPDAIGISMTGVVIGMQSYYASEVTIADFFLMICVVLFIDVVSSVISVAVNKEAVEGEGLGRECLWICNNLIFGVAMFAVLANSKYQPAPPCSQILIILACVNSLLSFGIAWNGYFRVHRYSTKFESRSHLRRVRRDELVQKIKDELSGDR